MTREQFNARFKEALKHWTQSVGTAGLGDCVWAAFYAEFTAVRQEALPSGLLERAAKELREQAKHYENDSWTGARVGTLAMEIEEYLKRTEPQPNGQVKP